jgi:hypothetical protein
MFTHVFAFGIIFFIGSMKEHIVLKGKFGAGMAVYASNPSYMGDLGKRIAVQGQPRQKRESLFKK